MFGSFERNIAMRYLRSRRKEGFISVIAGFSFLGISLGVATLIVVMAVMNGFRAELMERILGINAHISVSGYVDPITDYDELTKEIRAISGIKRAAPVVQGQVLATANGQNTGVVVKGMELSDLKEKTMIADNIIFGRLEEFRDGGVILGSRLARILHVLPGDTIRLISPKTTNTFFGNMPRLKDYRIIGLFEVGMFEYDSSTIFMPMKAAQLYFQHDNTVSSIEVDMENPQEIKSVTEKLAKVTGGKYTIIDWEQANSHFFNSLKVERNVMFLILTLIILVAAFNIIAGMVMLVTGKGKEIAILRTMGATKGAIMRIFFMAGAAIGAAGTFFGVVLGLAFSSNIESIRRFLEGLTNTDLFSAEIYFLSKLPADIQAADVTNVVLMALVLSFLATLYPAWRAAKISPAEGVRYE